MTPQHPSSVRAARVLIVHNRETQPLSALVAKEYRAGGQRTNCQVTCDHVHFGEAMRVAMPKNVEMNSDVQKTLMERTFRNLLQVQRYDHVVIVLTPDQFDPASAMLTLFGDAIVRGKRDDTLKSDLSLELAIVHPITKHVSIQPRTPPMTLRVEYALLLHWGAAPLCSSVQRGYNMEARRRNVEMRYTLRDLCEAFSQAMISEFMNSAQTEISRKLAASRVLSDLGHQYKHVVIVVEKGSTEFLNDWKPVLQEAINRAAQAGQLDTSILDVARVSVEHDDAAISHNG